MPHLVFHKSTQFCTPPPPLCAKYYLIHTHKIFCQNSKTMFLRPLCRTPCVHTLAMCPCWFLNLDQVHPDPLCIPGNPLHQCHPLHPSHLTSMTNAKHMSCTMSLILALIKCAHSNPLPPCQPCLLPWPQLN